jgi:hypothetical protein
VGPAMQVELQARELGQQGAVKKHTKHRQVGSRSLSRWYDSQEGQVTETGELPSVSLGTFIPARDVYFLLSLYPAQALLSPQSWWLWLEEVQDLSVNGSLG